MTELPPEEFGLVEVQDLLRIILWTHADSALEAARQLLSQGFDRDLCFVSMEAESGDWLCELVGDLCSGIIVALASGGGYSDGRLGLGAYALAKLKRWCPESALDGALGLLQQVRWADLPPFERRTVISAAHEIHRHLGWLWGVFPDPWACLKLEASPLEGATNSEGIDDTKLHGGTEGETDEGGT
jgi:hypothetical protein